MKRFCLLLIAVMSSLYGLCQEYDVATSHEGSSIGVEEAMSDVLFVDLMPYGEDLAMSFVMESENESTSIPPQLDYKESKYWGRYTALRTAGWITLGAGGLFFLGGTSMILGAMGNDSDSADALGIAGSLMLFSAPVLVVASIPLLGCAYWNRNKAKKMTLSIEASILRSKQLMPLKEMASSPALGLALNF